MGGVFPEIKEKQKFIEKVIRAEEESFNATLDRGIELFDKIAGDLKNQKKNMVPGNEVFKLYDTFGFPVDLTKVMASERNLEIDEIGFDVLMQKQRDLGKESSREKFSSVNIQLQDLAAFQMTSDTSTIFSGYDELSSASKITGIKKENGKELLLLDRTPFYVEAGGQIDDTGKILAAGRSFDVVDVARLENKTIHVIDTQDPILVPGAEVLAQVNESRRWDIMRNHTATHFLHSALRMILGTHVHQAGSYVGPDRLRFDFTHYSKLSPGELNDIESLVNENLRNNIPLVHHRNIPFEEAKKMGALMFFGDKYGDLVNVVQFGEFSKEFCGGTHVKNSSEIGLFKIISESSIASGVRRIEAVTGAGVEGYILSQLEKVRASEERVSALLEEKKKLEKEIADHKLKSKLKQVDAVISQGIEYSGIKIFKGTVDASNMDELKFFGDELRNKMKSGVGVLFSVVENKAGIVAVVSDDLLKEKKLSAGKIVGDLAKLLGGGGGGKPHLATAGGKDINRINEALNNVEGIVKNYLSA
jgi:alanyl-tRNA synthetase